MSFATKMYLRFWAVLIFGGVLPAMAPARAAAPTSTTLDCPLFKVEVIGKGPPVLLIPGLACSGKMWNETVAHLKDRYQCHVLSVKGFGGTPPQPGVEGDLLPQIRDGIIAYIRQQHLQHPVLIGHSLGGVLSMMVAETEPSLPRRLIIVDSLAYFSLKPFIGMDPPLHSLFAEMIGASFWITPTQYFKMGSKEITNSMARSPKDQAMIRDMVTKSDQATVTKALSELFSTDLRPNLGKITCPVLVMAALGNKMAATTPGKNAETFYANYSNLPQAKIQLFPDSRHFIMYDARKEFFKAVDQQLAARPGN